MSNPAAVIINDIHFNINTLPLASSALKQACKKATELQVPLIIAGDMHDTKASIRGECIKAMKDILSSYSRHYIDIFIIRGNHDSINEKSEEHSLEFLRDIEGISIIDKAPFINDQFILIPYRNDITILRNYLHTVKDYEGVLIMHQGLNGSEAGEYIQDKSALEYEDVKDFRVISGHYHRRQDIKTGPPRKAAKGLFSYTGNPYTLNYGEADHPEKGFHILMDDNLLEFVPTNLRKHIVLELELYEELDGSEAWRTNYPDKSIEPDDLIWVKAKGSKIRLKKINKEYLSDFYGIKQSFRLELIPEVQEVQETKENKPLNNFELLDTLIDSLSNTDNNTKQRLKNTWKNFVTKE